MDIEIAKKLISKYMEGHTHFVAKAKTAERYYNNDNDIHYREDKGKNSESAENPMRNADNKIALGFYRLLVQQKAAYMFTAPPVFDVGNDEANDIIVKALGDAYKKNAKLLCVNASNAGIGWVHYWKDETGSFAWAPVPSEQIIPVWSPKLDHKLIETERDSNSVEFDTYQGRRVIVDDGCPVANNVYTTYLFGTGAIAYGNGSPVGFIQTEVSRDPNKGAGIDYLYNRRCFIMHPRGIAWQNAVRANIESPSRAELANAKNWRRVYEPKQIRIVAFKHKIG